MVGTGISGKSFTRSLRIIVICTGIVFAAYLAYSRWTPGKDVTDGRHDLKKNAIYIQHGWLGDDKWFIKNQKKDKKKHFRDPEELQKLAYLLRQHNITDVFPHLCPASVSGDIPSVDHKQADLFLKTFDGFRVLPWVGGVLGQQVSLQRPEWRKKFVESISNLLKSQPEFSGIHINIEPCPSGNKDFLSLLDETRRILPKGKILSVAAFPPPTILHPFPDIHWDKDYYREVSKRADQLVVMMYDTSLPLQKPYQYLMSRWVIDILAWGGGTQILFGIPAYEDSAAGYHKPRVENIKNSILGINAGLWKYKFLPSNYQGIAVYCEWEMNKSKWDMLKDHFLSKHKSEQ